MSPKLALFLPDRSIFNNEQARSNGPKKKVLFVGRLCLPFVCSRILLNLHNKPVNFSQFGRELGLDPETISIAKSLVMLKKERLAEQILRDANRSGAPATYLKEQYLQIIALAFMPPSEHTLDCQRIDS